MRIRKINKVKISIAALTIIRANCGKEAAFECIKFTFKQVNKSNISNGILY